MALLEQGVEGTAVHELHGEERPAVAVGAELVNGDQAGVLQLAADLRLFHEAADQVGLLLVRFEENFDGQVAPQVGIASFEDNAHAAPGDLAQELDANGPVGGPGHLGRGRVDQGCLGGAVFPRVLAIAKAQFDWTPPTRQPSTDPVDTWLGPRSTWHGVPRARREV